MAYLIMRIEPCENTNPDFWLEKVITRCRLSAEAEPGYARRIIDLLRGAGYVTPEDWPVTRATKTDYPLTAYTYISQDKLGVGRVASTLKRIPVRKT